MSGSHARTLYNSVPSAQGDEKFSAASDSCQYSLPTLSAFGQAYQNVLAQPVSNSQLIRQSLKNKKKLLTDEQIKNIRGVLHDQKPGRYTKYSLDPTVPYGIIKGDEDRIYAILNNEKKQVQVGEGSYGCQNCPEY